GPLCGYAAPPGRPRSLRGRPGPRRRPRRTPSGSSWAWGVSLRGGGDAGHRRPGGSDEVLPPDLEHGPGLPAREIEDGVSSQRSVENQEDAVRKANGRQGFGEVLGQRCGSVIRSKLQIGAVGRLADLGRVGSPTR